MIDVSKISELFNIMSDNVAKISLEQSTTNSRIASDEDFMQFLVEVESELLYKLCLVELMIGADSNDNI